MNRSKGHEATVFYQALSAGTADATAELYSRIFLLDEPMTRRHAIDPGVFLPCARFYLRFCSEQQLSFIALEQENRDVVGFALGSDLTTDWESSGPEMAALVSLFRESMAILEEVEHRCPDLRDIQPGTVLHIFQLGVRRDFRGQGLSIALIHRILAEAKRRGFRKVIADCTGPASRRSCERCGFREAAHVSYDDFQVDGKAFFRGLPGRISLMTRDL
ncbi:MAG: GNAT family N-acetyltransferase [Methanoregulaceae archaeon]|nr:GNAT family N-acetyltransferase [Methanoregulaceae archaeon]